jgi:hypothetical protein
MAKQHHFVVSFDEDTNEFSIDWETTQARFADGNVWNKDGNYWESASIADDDTTNYDKQEVLDAVLNGWIQKINETLEDEEFTL